MTLPGNAFLALWHDIAPESWDDYMEWHTREHMPERLTIPGFLVGKRLINHDVPRYRYGTIYTGSDLDVFRSPEYLKRLNNPTPWSTKMQPAFRNFLRVACDRLASAGTGDGGAMATIRLDLAPGSEAGLRAGAQQLCAALLKVTGVGAAHIGLARSEVSGIRTRETDLRPGMSEEGFDSVILIEGSGRPELEAAAAELDAVIAESDLGLKRPRTIVYNLAWQLSSDQALNQKP